MLYLVECDFNHPPCEAEWNAFYSEDKLRALLTVSGFRTSQRFRCIHGDAPKYLAVHALVNDEVLASAEYRQKGGGNFGEWQPFIVNWKRSLVRGVARAPAVLSVQLLVLSQTSPDSGSPHTVPLEHGVVDAPGAPSSTRSLSVEDRVRFEHLVRLDGVCLYEPITEQKISDDDGGATA